MANKHPQGDRNFDDLTPKFNHKIYQSLKGQLRLAVLKRDFAQHWPSGPLNVLDVGAGQGQFARILAQQGHRLTLSDISPKMLAVAEQHFAECPELAAPLTLCGPLQALPSMGLAPFDAVVCHAVIEWLEDPSQLLPCLLPLIKPGGLISLIFYNLNALIFKNLLRANFKKIIQQDYRGTKGSLTPINPLLPEQVRAWCLEAHLDIVCQSGIRVFHDYILDQPLLAQQGEGLIQQELAFSQQMPYRDLGRYIHILAKKPLA